MELTVDRNKLGKAIQSAAQTLYSGSRIDMMLLCICLEAKRGCLIVSASNFVEVYREPIEADIVLPGIVFMPVYELKRMIEGYTGKDIHLSRVNIGLEIKNKFSSTLIRDHPNKDATGAKQKKLPHRFSLTKEQFREIYENSFFAIGENDSRKNLMGLNINKDGKGLVFRGADSFRITEYHLDIKNKVEDSELNGVILPKKSLKKISDIFKSSKRLRFGYNDDFFSVTDGQKYFHGKIIQAEFPNLVRLTQIDLPHKVTLNTFALLKAFDLLRRSSNYDYKAVGKFAIGDNAVTVGNRSCLIECATETDVPCEYEGEPLEIGLNVGFFHEALTKIRTKEFIMEFGAPDNPVYFYPSGVTHFKTIQMPVRIRW